MEGGASLGWVGRGCWSGGCWCQTYKDANEEVAPSGCVGGWQRRAVSDLRAQQTLGQPRAPRAVAPPLTLERAVCCACPPSCVRRFGTPCPGAQQAPLSAGFPGKRAGVGCCFLLPGPPDPGGTLSRLGVQNGGLGHQCSSVEWAVVWASGWLSW